MSTKRDNDTCRHFNGAFHNTACDAGVEYRSVTPDPDVPGCALRSPCRTLPLGNRQVAIDEFKRRGTCEKFELLSDEEFEKREAEIEAAFQRSIERLEKVAPLIGVIKVANKGKTNSGSETCPCCGKRLRWSIAACNGHVWMKCDGDDCINFME